MSCAVDMLQDCQNGQLSHVDSMSITIDSEATASTI